jgi:hypothetical protein
MVSTMNGFQFMGAGKEGQTRFKSHVTGKTAGNAYVAQMASACGPLGMRARTT